MPHLDLTQRKGARRRTRSRVVGRRIPSAASTAAMTVGELADLAAYLSSLR